MLKKIILLLVVCGMTSCVWAGDSALTEKQFLSWVGAQHLTGFEPDMESLENYDDREFTLDFMSTGTPCHLSLQISSPNDMASIKGDSNLGDFAETSVAGRKAVWGTIASMKNVSMLFVELPKIGGQLRLLTSPARSADEMAKMAGELDLGDL